MSGNQKAAVASIIALGAIALGLYQTREVSQLREEVSTLRWQQQQVAGLRTQVQTLEAERDSARQQVAALTAESVKKKEQPNEALKLRGEVSRLRTEKKELGSSSGLSKVTANPEARQMMRTQQKMGMSMLYQGFNKDAKLTPEQTEKFQDLLADHIMDNIENVTKALREKMTPEQLTEVFGAQETALQEKLRGLLGDEGLAKYQDYSRDLISSLSATQFKTMLTGDEAAKEEKSKQVSRILREEAQGIITASGLPADYQFIPVLNFRNIASESEGDRSIQLLDSLFTRTGERLGAVLDKKELENFQEFKSKAMANAKGSLSVNRTLMAPIGD